jgi:hypothetical protein
MRFFMSYLRLKPKVLSRVGRLDSFMNESLLLGMLGWQLTYINEWPMPVQHSSKKLFDMLSKHNPPLKFISCA